MAREAAPLTRQRTRLCALFGPWMLLLAARGPGDYYPYRSSYSYDPYYRPYWDWRDHRDHHHKREHRHAPPAPTYTKPTPSSPVGRTLGDVLPRRR